MNISFVVSAYLLKLSVWWRCRYRVLQVGLCLKRIRNFKPKSTQTLQRHSHRYVARHDSFKLKIDPTRNVRKQIRERQLKRKKKESIFSAVIENIGLYNQISTANLIIFWENKYKHTYWHLNACFFSETIFYTFFWEIEY